MYDAECFKWKREQDQNIDVEKYFLFSLLPLFIKFNRDQTFIACTYVMNVMGHVRLSMIRQSETSYTTLRPNRPFRNVSKINIFNDFLSYYRYSFLFFG